MAISSVLIANRGEIAVRIIRAAKDAGIASVAVYADQDRDAMHVKMADEAYALGGSTAAESYLNTEVILDVIERSGADGVHPGYGFLSERAAFPEALAKEGIVFIGPNPKAIEAMGDKIESKKLAMERLRTLPPTLMVFGPQYLKEVDEALGKDPFAYGVGANAAAIDMVQTISVEQGLTERKQPLNEIFAEEVLIAEERL